ncbi:MAG TPA: imidazole glycerol phosphate synthase cyclase subunit [Methylomirabilota bacterium]|nr:imidazole glycerol phosphate synthase cyclase subunit [Methylomirabilota bacterium]
MLKKRLIPSLVLRDATVVRSVNFKHTNVIHWKPLTAVDFFNKWAVDEIVVLDVSRDTSQRDRFYEVVEGLSRKCFVPLTVGGWVTSVEEVRRLLRLGADKVTINTEAVRRPDFITECARIFGAQCMVIAVDVRRDPDGTPVVWIDRGAERTTWPAPAWAREAEERGAGEVFLTSIDREGGGQGYDLSLVRSVVDAVSIPVVAFGGVFTWQHLVEGVTEGGADAVSAANVFHFTEQSTKKAKDHLRRTGIDVR